MIPRYQPTYRFSDLALASRLCRRGNLPALLKARLRKVLGVRHVFLFNSARAALYVLLVAHNRPGKVILPAYNCIVVPEAILYAGCQPVFADIDPLTLNMSTATLASAMTEEVTAVLMTHQFGIPSDVDGIMALCKRKGVLVIEDAAAALGAQVNGRPAGSLGDAAIISFGNTKAVSAGSGGALLTNNSDLADRVRQIAPESSFLKQHSDIGLYLKCLAWKLSFTNAAYAVLKKAYGLVADDALYQVVLPKAKMPDNYLQPCSPVASALCLIQLERLSEIIARRNAVALNYVTHLSGCSLGLPHIPAHTIPAWIQYPVMVEEKKRFYNYMHDRGIDLSWTFRYSCAESFHAKDCPNSEKAARTVLGLPTYPSLAMDNAERIAGAARTFFNEVRDS